MQNIYQPNSIFQPSQVVSTAPAYEAVKRAYSDSSYAASDIKSYKSKNT